MFSHEFIQNLSHQASRLFPAATAVQQDIEARLYDLLQAHFEKLNLVSREEFDAQLAVLERANQTIADLEQRVAELEARVAQEGETGPPAE